MADFQSALRQDPNSSQINGDLREARKKLAANPPVAPKPAAKKICQIADDGTETKLTVDPPTGGNFRRVQIVEEDSSDDDEAGDAPLVETLVTEAPGGTPAVDADDAALAAPAPATADTGCSALEAEIAQSLSSKPRAGTTSPELLVQFVSENLQTVDDLLKNSEGSLRSPGRHRDSSLPCRWTVQTAGTPPQANQGAGPPAGRQIVAGVVVEDKNQRVHRSVRAEGLLRRSMGGLWSGGDLPVIIAYGSPRHRSSPCCISKSVK